jgi:hypothetical protein
VRKAYQLSVFPLELDGKTFGNCQVIFYPFKKKKTQVVVVKHLSI